MINQQVAFGVHGDFVDCYLSGDGPMAQLHVTMAIRQPNGDYVPTVLYEPTSYDPIVSYAHLMTLGSALQTLAVTISNLGG